MTCRTLRPQGGTRHVKAVLEMSRCDITSRLDRSDLAQIYRSPADFQYRLPRMCKRQADGKFAFSYDSYVHLAYLTVEYYSIVRTVDYHDYCGGEVCWWLKDKI